MIIKNITIENFQSYYGTQTLEFSKGLNLIVGNGGKGKSKLFNAFYWVLFGKIYITDIGWCSTDSLPHSAKFSMKRHEFINKRMLFEAQVANDIRTSVHVELENDKGNPYEIERSVSARRLDDGNWQADSAWNVSGNILKVSHDSVSGTKIKTDILATDTINELFPDGIRNYIWFQGESLDTLINFRNKETLKAAVKHISYFPYYEKLSEIITKSKAKIEKLESAKIRDNNKSDKNIRGLLSTIEMLRNRIESEDATKQQLETNISKIQIALTEDEGKMSGLASFTSLVDDYNKCELNIQNVMNELTKLDNFQRRQVPNLWVLRGITPMIEQCKEIIKNHTEEQNAVPEKKYLDNPSRAKLEEILYHDKKCFVCGSDVLEGTAAHDWILHRLKEQEEYLREMEDFRNNMEFAKQFERFIGSIQDYPNSLKISLDSIEKQYSDSEERMEKLQAQKRQYLEKKKKLDEQIEEIKKKYGVNPVQQAQQGQNVATTIKASRSLLEKEQRKLSSSQEALAQYKAELRATEKELAKTGTKTSTITVSETEWKNISGFLEDICKRVQENARKDLLHKIEERANEFYRKFTEHDNGYKGEVKIGDDYSIEFDAGLNTSHEDRKKMSIINAMLSLNQDAIGTFYPFISDAPTSSFDFETTHKYLLGIKDIFRQSIIMTKDVDIESENYQDLASQDKVSRIYLLDNHLYCEDGQDPELHEVATEVKRLK
jgi:DNA sulfur modification protein DndD